MATGATERGSSSASSAGGGPIPGASQGSPSRDAHPGTGVPPHLAFQRRSHFDNLDGLRGVSILLVLLHHTTDIADGTLRALQRNAALGVPIFFAISGFLITTLLLREEAENGRISLPKFFGRRAVRLLPIYYIVLAAYCVLILGLHLADAAAIEAFRERLPGYLFYCSNVYAPIEGPFSHAWSLAYEEQFYFVFGFAMAFAPRRVLVGVAALAGLFYLVPLATADAWDPRTNPVLRALLFFPPSIVHGVLIGFLLATAGGYRRAAHLARPWIAAALFAATIGLLCVARIRAQPSSEALVMLVMALLVTSCVLQPGLPILGGRALSYIGKISYGIYLQHVLCRHVFVKLTGAEHPAVVLAGMLVLSIPLAHLSYRYFEMPLIRRSAPRLSARAAPRTST